MLIQLKNIYKTYNGVNALKNINLKYTMIPHTKNQRKKRFKSFFLARKRNPSRAKGRYERDEN